MKTTWLSIFAFFVLFHYSVGQPPQRVVRNGEIALSLKAKEIKEIKIAADSLDLLRLIASAGSKVNFKVRKPGGQVIYEALVKEAKQWSGTVSVTGDYLAVFENTNKFLPIQVLLKSSLERPDFSIGYAKRADSLKIPGEKTSLLQARSDIIRANPKSYPVEVKKGDTLNVKLSAGKGKSPIMQIESGKKELLWATLRQKSVENVLMPVFADDTYTINLTTNAFFKHTYELSIEKTTPTKYRVPKLPETPVDTSNKTPEVAPYDTIPVILIDTMINLAARRNILDNYEQTFTLQLADTTNVLYWGILYGIGRDFQESIEKIEPVLAGEAFQAVGATDVLSAYGLGLLKVLPGSSSRCLQIKVSPAIQNRLTATRTNYAILEPTVGRNYLYFNNECESVGQRVYIKAVVFKKNEK